MVGPPVISSPKFDIALSILGNIPCTQNKDGIMVREKAVVFSQWTSCLDLLEHFLRKKGYKWQRIDGTMKQKEREANLADYYRDEDCSIILLSLHAASTGLNIQCANHVMLMDLWWNPTVESQAVDRCHRINQTKVVHVYRFVLAGSIDHVVLTLQEKKLKMVDEVIYAKPKGATKEPHQDLNFIINGLREQRRHTQQTQERQREFGGLNNNWTGYLSDVGTDSG